jgi:two-component system cell cycle sensor histidine kinase/response regulator CckA
MGARAVWKAYVLAAVSTLAMLALTRLSWPFFAIAPFAPVFAAMLAATQWGTSGAGLFATALGAVGLAMAFDGVRPFVWDAPALYVFIAVSVVTNRVLHTRRRALSALRASEAELRATLAQMRASEEQLRRAQKMEAVGQLAAGVAHNFNNLLQVTMGYIDLLVDGRGEADPDRPAINEIRKATERGAALTRQLMAFSRRQESRVTRVQIDAVLEGLRDVLTRVVREDIELRLAPDSGDAAVMLDPSDFEQVVINLVINARDALPAGGAIQVESARLAMDAATVPPGQHLLPGSYVRIRVIDNGIGMPPEVQAHLFEPFFTTKEVGQGTGLGLAFVHGVAQHAGGFAAVDSAPGEGTIVSVVLPLAPAAAARAEPEPVAPGPAQAARAATILLVEDETGVRATTDKILTRAGYRVLAAANAAEAAALFDVHAASIDLLLTDVVMPGVHGPELAARLTAARPELPVVFMSGYSDRMPALQVVSARAAFVAKPFTAAHLTRTLEGLLNGDSA